MLNSLSKERIRPLVELNDRINALTKEEGSINSTRIVVVGDQSHGKSSLLEALSGVDLPRGEDIKTRVPLVMQLRESTDGTEYALISVEGQSEPPERITLDAVASKVDEVTARLAGSEKAVKDMPIELKVFRLDQDDLTLIDLPGITRIARDGQQVDGKELERLILRMSRRYCEPQESVILNVVSAMVDFSTSASLQLSQELDPTSRRTLLCVTKIDQHAEEGLAKKLKVAASQMRLRPERVFAVRNRKQQENEGQVSLLDARQRESDFLSAHDELQAGAKQCGYGLGVAALSASLVDIQIERIQETLPATYGRIAARLGELRRRSSEIGQPLGDELSCRLLAIQLIDQCVDSLARERSGRVAVVSSSAVGDGGSAAGARQASPVGETAELTVSISAIEKWRKEHKAGETVRSEAEHLPGGLQLTAVLYPKSSTEGIGGYLEAVLPARCAAVMIIVQMDLVSADGATISTKSNAQAERWTSELRQGRGWNELVASQKARELTGEVELCISAYVESVEWVDEVAAGGDNGDSVEDGGGDKLLCATLSDLDEAFTANVDRLHPERSFFSAAFAARLSAEADARRGAAGLPGAIAPEVPIGILRDLRKKLPGAITRHVSAISAAVRAKIERVVAELVDATSHPRFRRLLLQSASALLVERTASAQAECARLLEYEGAELHTSNHYYMDIVQQLRRDILAEKHPDAKAVWSERPFLQHLNFEALKKQSNREQELVDLQIKTFAYWKTLKKRLIDYVQMAARCNLSTELLNARLKPALLISTESAGKMRTLMAPDERLERERIDVAKRIQALEEAHQLLAAAPASLGLSLEELAQRSKTASSPTAERKPSPEAAPAPAPFSFAPAAAKSSFTFGVPAAASPVAAPFSFGAAPAPSALAAAKAALPPAPAPEAAPTFTYKPPAGIDSVGS